MSIKETIFHHETQTTLPHPTVSLHKAKHLTMLRLIVLALIFTWSANASRIKIIGGKDVETPGTYPCFILFANNGLKYFFMW